MDSSIKWFVNKQACTQLGKLDRASAVKSQPGTISNPLKSRTNHFKPIDNYINAQTNFIDVFCIQGMRWHGCFRKAQHKKPMNLRI